MTATATPAAASPVTHDLKCETSFFQALWDGRKTFELRENDREYRVGDMLNLREVRPEHPWQSEANTYTGRRIEAEVTYALTDGRWLRRGVVALGLGERRTFTGPASIPAPTRAGHHVCAVSADMWPH